MARISSYPIDSTIQDKDSWVGTESSNRLTRNFTAEDVANYVVASTSGVTGSGTLNTIPLWTPDGTKLGDSNINQGASGNITVGVNLTVVDDLSVEGDFEVDNTITVNGGGDSVFNSTVTFNNNISIYGDTVFEGEANFQSSVTDQTSSSGTAGQVLSSTGNNVQWVDSSAATTKLIPYFQLATPGGSDTYTQSNNIVDFDWSGGSGTYEYILPSATAIPYRTIRFVNNSTITASDKIHITAPGSETIDGVAFYSINKPYNGCAVWSDGVQWIVIQAKA